MERLTHPRSSGIKTGYWSPNKKDELVERLAEYENIGLTPEEVISLAETTKKQIPRRPQYTADGYWNGELVYDTWICPNCSKAYEVDIDNYDYCPNCGQRIDWEEDDVNEQS